MKKLENKEFKKVYNLLRKYSTEIIKSKTTNSIYFTLANDAKSKVRLSDHLNSNFEKYFINIVFFEKTGTCIIECKFVKINAYEKDCIVYLKHILFLLESLIGVNEYITTLIKEKSKCYNELHTAIVRIVNFKEELEKKDKEIENVKKSYGKELEIKLAKYEGIFKSINGFIKNFN